MRRVAFDADQLGRLARPLETHWRERHWLSPSSGLNPTGGIVLTLKGLLTRYDTMESIDAELATKIRNDILHGAYAEGERLSEAKLCDTHQVSRTPIRLALRILERESLVRRSDGRGYFVQSPTVSDIIQAVQVRGHLESLAIRLMAQSPDRHKHLQQMADAIDTIESLTSLGRLDDDIRWQMQAANKAFHGAILEGCANDYIGYTCAQISHLPMLEVGSMVFDRGVLSSPDQMKRGLFRLQLGNAQHKVMLEAVEKGDAVRAEGMMQEHSHTMIEYIQMFEKRENGLTVSDLISYSSLTHDATTQPNQDPKIAI